MDLTTPLMYVKGVGPARAAQLEAKGLLTVEDLLAYPPFRYEDRSNVKPIHALAPGETATVIAQVHTARVANFRRRRIDLFEATFRDGSQGTLLCKWFHGSYLSNVLVPGLRVALYGKIEVDNYTNALCIMHPEYEVLPEDDADASLHTGRIVPIYEAAGKVTTRMLRSVVRRILDSVEQPRDPLPLSLRTRLELLPRAEALPAIHFPPEQTSLPQLNAFRTPAQRRMIFEEFFWLEWGLLEKRRQTKVAAGISFALTGRVREQVKKMLPFKPTAAQKRVLGEIARDMAAPAPMHRLLQGDVGSGKTLVAAEAAIIAIENGFQAAVLAPTEILAAQHYLNFRALFEKLGYVVVTLTGSQTAAEKRGIKKLIAARLAHCIVGTHALLEEDVEFDRLGLAVVDEQHRFGVMQRLKLMRKGVHPDVLVMTATPIPRTLALTIYGDLDVSVIDELPPGRKPIQTEHFMESRIETVWSRVQREVDAGRQAYVVYPVIEESETTAVKAAAKMFEQLRTVVFPHFRVGLLHGRLKTDEKERIMKEFKRGAIQILVSTTVIEVGVDVPNATVMVIEQAERFGLAQLHQLRGRVGRGAAQSYCFLVTGGLNDTARERIRALVDSHDGFKIAEMDLRLRGPGEFFGTKQSGLPTLRFANIVRDIDILEEAREEAQRFIASGAPEERAEAERYLRGSWQRRFGLASVG